MSALAEVVHSNVFIYGGGEKFGLECLALCRDAGFHLCANPHLACFALAPRLNRILKRSEWSAPILGTLIFHPSILPYRRGPDAIRHSIASGERVSGVTWFWCDEGIDTGPICEQEAVLLKPGESAGRAYHARFIPAGLRALTRALAAIKRGEITKIEQSEELATYDPRFAQI